MCKFHSFSFWHGVTVGNDKNIVGIFPVEMKYFAYSSDSTQEVSPVSWISFGYLANVTILGLGDGGLILLLCTLFYLELILRHRWIQYYWYFSMVRLISPNPNSIASIFFSIYSTTFIDWGFVWAGSDFALASSFPVPNLFYNPWLKS